MHAHTKHNSPSKVDNELRGKGVRQWLLPVIHAHTKHNSPPKVDNGLEGEGERHWSLPVIYMYTLNTTHRLRLIMN